MKTKTHPCATCGLPVCAICHGHKFPPKEAAIELSDKKHGGDKKTGCACPQGRASRKYGQSMSHPWKAT